MTHRRSSRISPTTQNRSTLRTPTPFPLGTLHRFELLTFLEQPEVPADNNLSERDIRSVAAARSNGGVNRTAWGAEAFATWKSVNARARRTG